MLGHSRLLLWNLPQRPPADVPLSTTEFRTGKVPSQETWAQLTNGQWNEPGKKSGETVD